VVIVWLGLSALWALLVYVEAYPRLLRGLSAPHLPEMPSTLSPNASWAALPVALLLVAAAHGIGRRILSRAGVRVGSDSETAVLSTVFGFIPVSFAFLSLGVVQLFRRPILGIVLALLLFAGFRENVALVSRIIAGARSLPAKLRGAGVVGAACMLLIGGFFLLGSIAAVAPETSTDALLEHVFAVSRYLALGGFEEIAGYEMRHVPELEHGLFLPLYAFVGDVGPKSLVFVQGALTALLAGLVASDLGGRVGGWVAALVVVSTPAFLSGSTVGYTDVPLAMFAFAAFSVAVRFGDSEHGAWLAGILAGAAAATKHFGAPLVFPTLLLVVWRSSGEHLREVATRTVLRRCIRVSLGAALVVVPFYVKDWITLGNPFYPLFATRLGAYRFDPADIEIMIDDARARGAGRDLKSVLLLPWNLSVHGERYEGCFGGLLLATVPLAWAAARVRAARGLLLAAALFAPVYAVGQHTMRWTVTMVPLLAIVLAVSLDQLRKRGPIEALGARAFTGLTLATAFVHLPIFCDAWLGGWFPYELRTIPTRVVLGGQSRDDYLASVRPIAPLAKRFVRTKRDRDKVLGFPEWDDSAPPTWFEGALVDNIPATHIVREMLEKGDREGPDAMLATATQHGITHLLVRTDASDVRLARLSEGSPFGRRYLEPVDRSGPYTLYALGPRTSEPVFLDLVTQFSTADVSPKAASEPPARVLSFGLPGEVVERTTVTILAGGSASFPVSMMPEHATFQAELAMPWSVGDGAIAVLSFVDDRSTSVLLRQALKPPAKDGAAGRWIPVNLDLANVANRRGALVLSTDPGPSGDATGDWVGWASARVVAPAADIDGDRGGVVAYDLLARLPEAEKSPPSSGEPTVREFEVERDRTKEHTVTTLAGGFVKFPVKVPPDGATFEALSTMPLSGGDGAVALVRFEDGESTTELVRVPLAPAASPGSRAAWTPVRADLSVVSGKDGKLVLSTDPGPAGNATADWISWARPHIVANHGLTRRVAARLDESFEVAKKEPEFGAQVRKFEFVRGGQRRSTIVTLAFAKIAFEVEVPTRAPRLEASIAMPFSVGDGAVAVVRFIGPSGDAEVLRQGLKPAPSPGAMDTGWTAVDVDLAPFAGRRGSLVLSTDPGPAGDAAGDWIGWAGLRISDEPLTSAAQAQAQAP
jgi:hypothetical protein